MPRPSSPLISHDAVVEASLRIIDREGLDAFSLPRLARELNVQTPSLYYHFRDRADILRTVARAIVLESRVPAPDACRTWVDWFVGISLSFRRAVLSHRNAAPILLEFMPRDVLIWNYELGVQILAAVGVPPEARIGVIDGLDTLTLGASLAEAARSPARAGQVFANVDADAEPMLADALAANTRTAEQLFADSIRSFLRGAVPGVPPDVPAPRALIARYRDTRAAAASHDGLDGSGLPAAHPAAEDELLGGFCRQRRGPVVRGAPTRRPPDATPAARRTRPRPPAGRLPDALKSGFHGVRTPWIRGLMPFRLARRTRTKMLMVSV